MENAAKALEIAAGVLLGVMLFALVAYFFKEISASPEQEDDIKTAEQLAKFNLEYEVYDKKAMYGVDVISCLNKAINNNRKYAEGGSFLAGKEYGSKYKIDVWVHMASYLSENIQIYRIYNGKEERLYGRPSDYINETPPYDLTKIPHMRDLDFDFGDGYTYYKPETELDPANTLGLSVETDGNMLYHEIKDASRLYAQKINNSFKSLNNADVSVLAAQSDPNDYYKLLPESGSGATSLEILMEFDGNNMRQVKRNVTGENQNIWSMIIWETPLYDLKKKKFKCDEIIYDDETNRVKTIKFSEIDI